MRKLLTVSAAALALGGVVVGAAAPAEARWHGGGYYGGHGYYGGGGYYAAAVIIAITMAATARPFWARAYSASPRARRLPVIAAIMAAVTMTTAMRHLITRRRLMIIMAAPTAVRHGVGTVGRAPITAFVIATDA